MAAPRDVADLHTLQALIRSCSPGAIAWIGLNDMVINTAWHAYWGDPDAGAPILTWPNKARDNSGPPYGDYDIQFHAWSGDGVPNDGFASPRNCAVQQEDTSGARQFGGVTLEAKWGTRTCTGPNHARPYACYGVSSAAAAAASKYVKCSAPSPPPPPLTPHPLADVDAVRSL